MKFLAVTFFVIFLATVTKAQTNRVPDFAPERRAILEIKTRMMESVTNSVEKRGKRYFFNRRKFAVLINKIDTHQCPTDFRLAWNDFAFAYQQRVTIKASGAGLIEVIGGLGSALEGYLPGLSMAAKGAGETAKQQDLIAEAQRKLNEAEHALKDVVIKYGL